MAAMAPLGALYRCHHRNRYDPYRRQRHNAVVLGLVLAMNVFVVSGLVKCRAELAGEIERTHEAPRETLACKAGADDPANSGQAHACSDPPRRAMHRRRISMHAFRRV
jgi:hypothetical protein